MLEHKALAALTWFGYGRWAAPYWFVGMEPAGQEDPRLYEGWHRLGCPELLDLRAHSLACDDMRWLGDRPPLQRTWAQLIRIVLGFEDLATDTEQVRRYQRDRLGRNGGDTLLIELSSISARSLSVAVPEREHHRAERVATIRQRMKEHRPRFVVFYGTTYREDYSKVAGEPFDDEGYRWSGSTLCVLVRHPTARPSLPASWWSTKGKEIAARVLESLGSAEQV